MYHSPIEMFVTDIQHQIEKQQDEEIYKAVASVGFNVSKAELLRALQYDRNQYEKGYLDGKYDATPKWVPAAELLPELHTKVLCCGIKGGRFIAETSEWGEGHIYWTKRNGKGCPEVVYWMPLPDAP